MKRGQVNNSTHNLQSSSYEINSSDVNLQYGQTNSMMPLNKSRDELLQEQKKLLNINKKEGLDHLHKESYQPAKYSKALQYRNSRSYLKKLSSGQYQQLDLFGDTQELRQFGLGPYLYIQFFRRMSWLFLVLSLLIIVNIIINWQGSGMSSYSSSFSTYLIKSTLGNYTYNCLTSIDGYLLTLIPAINYLAIFIFYIIWKAHTAKCIAEQQNNVNDVKPQKFCVEINGLDQKNINQDQLGKFFSTFGPVYEVSLVRRHKNKLAYFEDLQKIQEQVNQMELQVILGGGDKQKLTKLKGEKQGLQSYINTLQIQPKILSAFIHFQYQKSKTDCLTYFNNHFLFDVCSHICVRNCCCCCVPEPEQKYIYNGKKLTIKNEKVPDPIDINWSAYQITQCGSIVRILFAGFIIIVFLAISCAIIGLCSIYIASRASDCQNVIVPTTTAQAQASTDSKAIQCFCDANLVSSFSDSTINSICSPYLSNIYISQAIQYAVIITSSITNFLFDLIVDKLVYFVRPASKSSGMFARTALLTIFLIFNTILIPILIYADIFGVAPSKYISFITMISSSVDNFFQVSSITFYPSFNAVWYRNVSVIYVNFIIINTVMTWIMYLKNKYSANKSSLQKDEGKILQKHMNEQITSYKLDIYHEAASVYLIFVMCGLFWAGIPILIPLGFINIVSRYITNRSLLQYSSSRVDGLGQQFVSFSLGVFPFIVILCPLVGQWMLTSNSSIYPNALSMNFPYLTGAFYQLDIQLYLPFYLALSIVAFSQFFLYNTFIRFISCLCSICYEKKQVVPTYHTRPFSEYAKGINMLISYNIKNNDEMRNIMLNMQKHLVEREAQ